MAGWPLTAGRAGQCVPSRPSAVVGSEVAKGPHESGNRRLTFNKRRSPRFLAGPDEVDAAENGPDQRDSQG